MSLLPGERAQYSAIIDGILASSDLTTISAKAIRKGLAAALDKDLSDKKQIVQDLIMERFDHAQANADPIPTIETAPPSSTTNGYHTPKREPKTIKSETQTPATSSGPQSLPSSHNTPDSPTPSEEEDITPPKKKARKNISSSSGVKKEIDDAKLAAMLQAQENQRGRSTRGGGVKKQKPVKKRAPKRKSEKKVGAEDDSEIEVGSDGEIKERPKKGGFHKLYHLSAPLAELVGEPALSRPQVVKKIWIYIKAHDLQDPSDKRQIRCDEKMQLVFKLEKVHMFTMNKILGKQLYDIEE